MHDADIAMLMLRLVLGVVFVMHGYNHGFGPGGMAGTARWFGSLGLQPARVHAAISTYAEIAAGIALIAGLATPAAAAVGIGVMATAFSTVHRFNGFFIIKEGYEYVLTITVALTVLTILGPGAWSLDRALGLDIDGLAWGLGAAAVGIVGTLVLLATSYRPPAKSDS